ncbi:MAG: hypothetical protein B7Y53_01115, partial [Halothiobacillus sp. 28-55-5]
MSEHTFITGKDAALEDTISRIQSELAALGFELEETRWLNPVPHCWSVHIRDTHCPILFTNGKGASKKAALASALGEFVERLASQYFFGDFHWHREDKTQGVHDPKERWFVIAKPGIRPEGLLDDALWRHFEADAYRVTTEDWLDFNSGVNEALCALPYTRIRDEKTVYFPANVVANLYVSNGLTAGNTVFEARTQGLSEVFERFVKNRVISEGIALPHIPDAIVAGYPRIAAAIAALRGHGFGLRLMDASLGGQLMFASFGAHPSFEVAFERTVTELLQGRALEDLHVFHPPTPDRELVSDAQNLELHFIDSSGWLAWQFFRDTPDYAFVHWDFTAQNNEAGFAHLCAIVHAQGFEVYVADYPHVGLYACRVLVPGMSEVYPVDELYERNNTKGRALVPFAERLCKLNAAERAQLFEAIEAMDLDWLMPVTDVIGLAADPGSPWESLRIGELRALALLGQKNHDDDDEREALLDWLATVPPIPDDRNAIYHAAVMLNQLQMANLTPASDYASTLALMYNADTLAAAQHLLEGTAGFLNIPSL